MCLLINLFSRKKIAQEDIPVYKILRYSYSPISNKWTTPYRKTRVDIMKPMEASLSRSLASVNRGIHSYITLDDAYEVLDAMDYYITDKSFHVVKKRYHILKAIIPKGSEYYIGIHEYEDGLYAGSIASNKLIIDPEEQNNFKNIEDTYDYA